MINPKTESVYYLCLCVSLMKRGIQMEYSKEFLQGLYRTMVRERVFDLKVEELFSQSKLVGGAHFYTGQEAIAAGAMANLRRDDYITSTHRGHGHVIAKGADTKGMMAELYGKKTGLCKGKGGSMHVADFSIGVLGANGEAPGGVPIATGAGMAIKFKKSDQVVISFLGDGASNRGPFHEALNWCAVYRLPVIFLVENNQWVVTARTEEVTSEDDIAKRAGGYRIPGVSIDGNDVITVYETVKGAVERARAGEGPTLIVANTYRLKGHFNLDTQPYRSEEEVMRHFSNEPIGRFEAKLKEVGVMSDEEKEAIWDEANKELDAAVEFAENSPFPAPEEALEDMFAQDAGYDYY